MRLGRKTPEEDVAQARAERARAEQARRILDDPLFQEAWSVVESEIQRQWAESPARDTEGRETLWMMLKLLGKVRGHLSEAFLTGKLADAKLAELEK